MDTLLPAASAVFISDSQETECPTDDLVKYLEHMESVRGSIVECTTVVESWLELVGAHAFSNPVRVAITAQLETLREGACLVEEFMFPHHCNNNAILDESIAAANSLLDTRLADFESLKRDVRPYTKKSMCQIDEELPPALKRSRVMRT